MPASGIRLATTALTPVATAGAATAVLALAGPSPAGIALLVGSPAAFSTEYGADAALAAAMALLGWAGVTWLCCTALLAVGAQLPGSIGRVLRPVSRYLVPKAVLRAVRAGLGTTVLTSGMVVSTLSAASVPAFADAPTSPSAAVASASPAGPSLPELDWPKLAEGPTDAGVPKDAAVAATTSTPAAPSARPVAATPTPTPTPTEPGSVAPAEQVPRPAQPTAQPAAPVRPEAAAGSGALALRPETDAEREVVVVQRGDTLWSIAARRLGPRAGDAAIAASWPRWYAANRSVIGADPDLILPGQQLRAPWTAAR